MKCDRWNGAFEQEFEIVQELLHAAPNALTRPRVMQSLTDKGPRVMQHEQVVLHAWEGGWLQVELRCRVQVVPERGQDRGSEQLPNLEARVLVGVPQGQVAAVVPAEPPPTIERGVTQLTQKKKI